MLISIKGAKALEQEVKTLEGTIKALKLHSEQYGVKHDDEIKEMNLSVEFYKKVLLDGGYTKKK